MEELPIPENERGRLEALKNYEILDSLSEAEYDRITKLASIICGTPVSLITFIEEERQWFKSKVGLDIEDTPRDIAFCRYTIMDQAFLQVKDARLDDRFKNNPAVLADPHVRFYAGFPLTDPNGYNLGTLCVIDYQPKELSPEQIEALEILTEEVMELVTQRREKIELLNFQKLFMLSSDLICVANTAGFFKRVNPAFKELLGWSETEMLSKNLFDLLHPDDYKATIASVEKLKQGKLHIKFEHRIRTASGDYKFFQWVVSPEKETDKLFAVGRDVTLQNEMKDQLMQVTAMLQQTSEVAQVGGWQYDLITNKLEWSDVTRKMHEVPDDFEIIPDLNARFIKEGPDRDRTLAVMQHAIQTGEPWSEEVQLVTYTGREIWVKTIGTPVMKDGVCVRLYGSMQDIDQIKRAELEASHAKAILLSFVTYAPAAIAMLDKDMCYIAVSNRWMEEYGLMGKDIIGKSYYTFFDFVTEEGRQRHQRVLNGAIERKDEDLYLGTSPEGDQYISWEMRPWSEADGTVGGMMIYSHNVTPAVQQRKELNEAKIAAEQGSIAKSDFLANMSHEIRTPLNGVIGFTDLVLKTDLNETQRQYLSIVNQSGTALLEIINDILDFSKIEAGKLELDQENCDIYELSNQVTDIISYQVQKKGLEMLLNLSTDLPRFIWADAVRLKQILVNLLGNAAKFTETGEIELKIQVLDQRQDMYLIRFGVRDTGIGIQEDKRDKIFEAFAQEDGSTTKKYGGTGLGLAISNKLLWLMDSQLELNSTVGKGSQFYFDCWLRCEQGEAKQWENISWIKNVLVVDDNENNRLIMQEMLLLKGIESTSAKNGYEAIQILASGKTFDVILMDYHMPFIDGLDTIRQIRKQFRAIKKLQPIVLLFSSADDDKIIKACDELKVNARLSKPVKMQELYETLSRLLLKERNTEKPKAEVYHGITQKQISVLIADDNPINLLLARTIIRRAAINAHIMEATNGLELLALYQQQKPDLILMDVQMPEMNGYEATQEIRKLEQEGQHTPIIALTAGNVKNEREKCVAAGMDDFVVKPVVEETITQLLKKWLNLEDQDEHMFPITLEDHSDLHFEPAILKSHIGDDAVLLAEIMTLTKKQLQTLSAEMEADFAKGAFKEVAAEGHKIYGIAVSAGLPQLAKHSRDLELAKGKSSKIISQIYASVKAEIEICITQL